MLNDDCQSKDALGYISDALNEKQSLPLSMLDRQFQDQFTGKGKI